MSLRTSWIGGCAGLALFTSGPALAVGDLSGTYEGKLRCETTAEGVVTRTKQDVVVEVDDAKTRGVTFEILAGAGQAVEDRIIGLVIQDGLKAENGVLPAASCDYESFDQVGLVARLAVRVRADGTKASLKGALLRSDIEEATSSICTLDVKRVATEVPVVDPCLRVVPIP
jgi:hypothetical protein